MKKINLLIVANNCKWESWPDKIADLKRWAKTIDLQIDIRYTNYDDVPFSIYNPLIDQYNKTLLSGQVMGVNPVWYDKNVSSQAVGYDIVLFVLNNDQWDGNSARGWRADNNYGPIETQVGADENEAAYYPDGRVFNSFLVYAKHEIAHALYIITGQADRVHEFYYNDDLYCDKVWGDLKFATPNNYELYNFYWNYIYNLLRNFMTPETKIGDLKLISFARAIQTHEGWFAGSRSMRNLNPGNIRFCGQRLAIGQDKQGFAIFKTYSDGFSTLVEMIRRAADGRSKVYSPEDTIQQFFSKYAPQFDNNDPDAYAKAVAKDMGVDVNFKIKDLLV